MILTCPSCQQKYMVTNRSIGPAGRMVRCDNCQHEWFEASPVEEGFGSVAPAIRGPAAAAATDFSREVMAAPPAPSSMAEFDPFADPFAAPAKDSTKTMPSDFSSDFDLPKDLGKPPSNPDDYSFDSPEWQSPAVANKQNQGMPVEPNAILNQASRETVKDQPAIPRSDNSVKGLLHRINLGKSDTEIEFESMIKELDQEMVGLGDMPDLDQLTSFHKTAPIGRKKGLKIKKAKNRPTRPRTGNFMVAIIVSAVMALFVMVMFFGRGQVVDLVPQLGKAYRLAGISLPVKNIGLDFQEIRFEKSSGPGSILVHGTVLNLSNLPKFIPTLEAAAHNGQGEVIKTWQLTLSLPILLPGDNSEFRAPIDNIPPATSEIRVNFLAR
ncbi:MAG: zinc-ribbon domain-containing protein [Candidatus Pacebacteria bacterium]|nr:zinc-ribbon domain-containing protein [Candidatus Paceibacterota bacterium]